MRKLLSIFSLALLYVALAYGQAQIDRTITVTDDQSNSKALNFGLDATATTGIDPALGESDLPPFPPAGVFEARFNLQPFGVGNLSTYRDYRLAAAYPFSGTVEHRLIWQLGDLATNVTIAYNLPPQATMVIQDAVTGTIFNSGTLSGTGNYVPLAGFTTARMIVTYTNILPALPGPLFSLSPATLNFGTRAVGSATVLPVTVSNPGTTNPLTITNAISTNGAFTVSPTVFPIIVAAGGSQVFNVTFTAVAGLQSGSIDFTHDAPGSPSSLGVSGTGELANFTFSAPSLSFGSVGFPGQFATLPVTVTNNATFATLSISGALSSNPVFTFAPNAFPITLAPGASQIFNVTFTPVAGGPTNGTIDFTHNGVGSPSSLLVDGVGQEQGGSLEFKADVRQRLDGTTNNVDSIMLRNYSGQNLKALQFKLEIGKTNGMLILRSISRGAAIPTPQFNFSYEIFPGPTRPDGSSIDIINVVILGNGTNSIPPGAEHHLMTFAYDIVDIVVPSAQTFIGMTGVLGSTETPVIDALITADADQVINIGNGTPDGLLGDVNLDNFVNILDILEMIDYILERTGPWTAQQIFQGDIAPWTVGAPLPTRDGLINVLDLAVLQNIVLTGHYPSGIPVYKVANNDFQVTYNSLDKITPGMNAKLTFYVTEKGIAVELESLKKVKGVQMELDAVKSIVPINTSMTSIFDQAFFYQQETFLRMLSFDAAALPLQPGRFFLADLPFNLNKKHDVQISDVIVADENNQAMSKVEVEIKYEGAPFIPTQYLLEQNYPNPFNPSTSVQFQIPQDGLVTIKVYDLLGQEVATLFSGDALAGTYTLNWNGLDLKGSAVASGNYIYRMTAGDFVQSKKMTLLK